MLVRHADAKLAKAVCSLLFWLIVFVLLMPDVAWVVHANGKMWTLTRAYALAAGLFSSCIVLTLFFAAFGRHLWLGILLLVPFVACAPLETAYIFRFGEPSWYAMIATALESNTREIVDFLGPLLWVLVLSSFLLLILSVVSAFCARKVDLQWTGKSRIFASTIAVLFVAIVAIGDIRHSRNEDAADSKTVFAFGTFVSSWRTALEPSYPLGLAFRFVHFFEERSAIRSEVKKKQNFRFDARRIATLRQRQIYVLVIGEASRWDRWQLFGYSRETNPELSQQSNLIPLSNFITPWSASREAVPIIATRMKGTDLQRDFSEPSVTRVFSEAGFKTFWLSNQIAFGELESPISIVAYDAQQVAFYNVADYSNTGTYDDVLLAPLREAIATGKDLFVVLHTLGSHENYALRYPEQFDKFKPSLKGTNLPDMTDVALSEKISNTYDNSILFTDHFLAEVIRELDRADSIATMLYVADHGEDLVNSSCKLSGHGSGSIYNFRVPALFWFSAQYGKIFPEKIAALKEHSQLPQSTENIFESLVDMANIDFATRNHTWSLFSEDWQRHTRIVTPLFGSVRVDFDKAEESPNCHILRPSS